MDGKKIIAGVYALLGRPSDLKLPSQDIWAKLNDYVRLYISQMGLGSMEELRTQYATGTVVLVAAPDYTMTIAGVTEFDIVDMEYTLSGAGPYCVVKADIESFHRHRNKTDYVAAVFLGDFTLENGIRLRLNIVPAQLANYVFKVAYRPSLVDSLNAGDWVPLPIGFMTMLKLEVALAMIPMVKDDSDTWKTWVKENEPKLMDELKGWKRAWEIYLQRKAETTRQFAKNMERLQPVAEGN